MPNWGLIAVGIWAGWMALRNLDKIERQIKHAGAQNSISRRGLALSRETTKKQLRAYVMVESAMLATGDINNIVEKIILSLKNYGQTPAYDVTGWIESGIQRFPLNATLTSAKTFLMGKDQLAPGRSSEWRKPIGYYQVPENSSADKVLYVFGEVTYRDAFGDQHRTTFQMMGWGPYPPDPVIVNDPILNMKKTAGYRLMPDTQGNEAD